MLQLKGVDSHHERELDELRADRVLAVEYRLSKNAPFTLEARDVRSRRVARTSKQMRLQPNRDESKQLFI